MPGPSEDAPARDIRDLGRVIMILIGIIEARGRLLNRVELAELLRQLHETTPEGQRGAWLPTFVAELQTFDVIRQQGPSRFRVIDGGASPITRDRP